MHNRVNVLNATRLLKNGHGSKFDIMCILPFTHTKMKY